MVQNSSNIA